LFSLIKRKMVAGRRRIAARKPERLGYRRAMPDAHDPRPAGDLPTLRRLLMTLAAGCVIPIALVALGNIAYQYHRERLAVEASAIATARALVGAVDDRLQDVEMALAGLSTSPQLTRETLPQFQQQALLVQRTEEITNIVLLDADGHQLMNTGVSPGTALPVESRAESLAPIRRGRSTVLDVFKSPATGLPTVGIGIPVRMHDNLTYGLNAGFDPAILRNLLLRQKLPSTWFAGVLDSNGNIVARTHEQQRYVGTPVHAALRQRIQKTQEGTIEGVNLAGVAVTSAFSRSPTSNWSVVVAVPRQEFMAPARAALAELLAAVALVIGVISWLAWSMAGRVSDSIQALGAAVRAAGHEPILELPPARFQEAHQLGQAFLSATAELQDTYGALRRNEERLRNVLDTAVEAIVTADESGRIVLFNRAAEALFRIGALEALETPLDQFLPLASRDTHLQQMRSFGVGGQASRMMGAGRVIVAQRADGTQFPADVSLRAPGGQAQDGAGGLQSGGRAGAAGPGGWNPPHRGRHRGGPAAHRERRRRPTAPAVRQPAGQCA
jgi:PAS domain S-box-containing protein